MKIRLGFITNSSSSSYIFSFKKDNNIDMNSPFVKILMKLVTRDGEIISTKEDLDEYIVKEYGWNDINTLEKIFDDQEYLREEYDKMLSAINNREIVIFNIIDYDDESFIEIINELEKEKIINIIRDGG